MPFFFGQPSDLAHDAGVKGSDGWRVGTRHRGRGDRRPDGQGHGGAVADRPPRVLAGKADAGGDHRRSGEQRKPGGAALAAQQAARIAVHRRLGENAHGRPALEPGPSLLEGVSPPGEHRLEDVQPAPPGALGVHRDDLAPAQQQAGERYQQGRPVGQEMDRLAAAVIDQQGRQQDRLQPLVVVGDEDERVAVGSDVLQAPDFEQPAPGQGQHRSAQEAGQGLVALVGQRLTPDIPQAGPGVDVDHRREVTRLL